MIDMSNILYRKKVRLLIGLDPIITYEEVCKEDIKCFENVLEDLISTIENNSVNNKAEIINVSLWAEAWRRELNKIR